VKRSHGSGHLYVKHGSYYGRWRGADGRFVNKKIGSVRRRGEKDGITRAEAERGLRRLVEAETRQGQAEGAEVAGRTSVKLVINKLGTATGKRFKVRTARRRFHRVRVKAVTDKGQETAASGQYKVCPREKN
jgi:hypothetical protein